MGADRVCVGGLTLPDGISVRLLGSDGHNLLESHPIRPGEEWEIAFHPRERTAAPHVEDVIATGGRRIGRIAAMKQRILDLVDPWDGPLDATFDGCLQATPAGTGFVSPGGGLPRCSTGFWIAPHDVPSTANEYGLRYRFGSGRVSTAKYVGMESPADTIHRGALVRLSLSRPVAFDGQTEPRCFLMVSGWFG